MDPWIGIYIKYYGLFLASAVILYLAGRVVLRLFSSLIEIKGFYQETFFSIAVGVFITVIISSLIKTKFASVSTGYLLTGFFLILELWLYKRKNNKIFQLECRNKSANGTNFRVVELFFISIIFYSWQAAMIFKAGSFPFMVPERDYIYYADLAEILWRTGQENNYLTGNLISTQFWGISPYHYFEMWMSGFFSWLYRCETLFSDHLLVFPLFFCMMALSVLSVAESVSDLTYKNRMMVLMLLFTGAIPFILDYGSDYCKWLTAAESPVIMEKTSHHFWIAMIGFLFILNNFFTAGFLVILSLVFVSAALVPGISFGGIAVLLLSFFFRLQARNEIVRQIVYLAGALMFFTCLYLLVGNMNFSFRTAHPILYYSDLYRVVDKGWSFFAVKYAVVEALLRVYKLPFYFFIQLSPYLLMLFFLAWKRFRNLKALGLPLAFVLSAYFGVVFFYGFFFRMYDSGQFIDAIYFFVFILITLAFILLTGKELIEKNRNIFLTILACIFLLKVTIYLCNRTNQFRYFKNIYSDEFLSSVAKKREDSKSPAMGVCFRALPGKNRIMGRNAEIANRIAGYTDFFSQYGQTVNLSLVLMSEWDQGHWGEMEQTIVRTSPFFQYMEEQKRKAEFVGIVQSQLDFIDEFRISYAVAEREAIVDSLILARVKETITDKFSGERFMLLE